MCKDVALPVHYLQASTLIWEVKTDSSGNQQQDSASRHTAALVLPVTNLLASQTPAQQEDMEEFSAALEEKFNSRESPRLPKEIPPPLTCSLHLPK
jgi:hypothetical protein